jgi:hypothetical protein
VYVFLPEAQEKVRAEARAQLGTRAAPPRESLAIPLERTPEVGEHLVARVELGGFEMGTPEPVRWRPPRIHFVVTVRAGPDVLIGVHQPRVTLRSRDAPDDVLADFTFDLHLCEPNPWASLRRSVLTGGAVFAGVVMMTAAWQHLMSLTLGLPLGAALLAGSATAWVRGQAPMVVSVVHKHGEVHNNINNTNGTVTIIDGDHNTVTSTVNAGVRAP